MLVFPEGTCAKLAVVGWDAERVVARGTKAQVGFVHSYWLRFSTFDISHPLNYAFVLIFGTVRTFETVIANSRLF